MRILALHGASAASGVGFGLLSGDTDGLMPLHEAWIPGRDAGSLPLPLRQAIRDQGWRMDGLDLVAVICGPGSFTGLRATLALAHGLALGSGARLVAVSVGEAMAPVLCQAAGAEAAWCVSQARRGRVFIERMPSGSAVEAAMLDALPDPGGPVLLGGDAATLVAAVLPRARVLDPSMPSMRAIAAAALRQLDGRLPTRPVQPLYVDAPEARRPA